MKKMLATAMVLVPFLLFLIQWPLSAQEVQKQLNDSDLKRFIQTFQPIGDELEKLGLDFETDEENPFTFPEAIMTDQRVLAILRKYGWGAEFFPKTVVIMSAYTVVMLEAEVENQIKANPDMKDVIQSTFEGISAQLAGMVHPADIELVRGYSDQISTIAGQ
ncbi:MAG: hypothetical protein AB1798_11710 [Spirochaetota bacterium]